MRLAKLFLIGIGVGAGVTYFCDSRQGHRRRAMARDKVVHFACEVREQADAGMRDLSHRVHGLMSQGMGFLHTLTARHPVSDDILHERVRSAMGRVCSHAHAVHVMVDRGCVELTGLVLSEEHAQLVRHVARVPGVVLVRDYLEPHAQSESIPNLQGPPRTTKPKVARTLSSPAGRLVLGSAALLALGAWAPALLIPMGTILGIGVAARNEDQARARRARSLERRGSRRTAPADGGPRTTSASSPSHSSQEKSGATNVKVVTSSDRERSDGARSQKAHQNGHQVGSPTGHARPVPPRPQ
ncbi:BON domain-containing protein [Pendulispora albinea]|uniref:BON domain-containing protein n=1 Tax=Pendulispora albinea TaxID=2741071 RepID=A0ABZ2LUW1_9BACT